jgi:PAS domain S-box-containing protein
MVVAIAPDFSVEWINRTACEWLCRDAESALHLSPDEILGGEIAAALRGALPHLEAGDPVRCGPFERAASGATRSVLATFIPRVGAAGQLRIDALIEVASALGPDVQEEMPGLLEDISIDAIFRFDPHGVITYASPSAGRHLGLPPGEIAGRHFGDFFSAEAFPGAAAVFERAAAGERVGLIEVTATRADGSEVELEVAATPILRDGRVAGVLGVARDVSVRNRAVAGLRRYRDRLEELLEERSDELRRAYERFDRHLLDRVRIEDSLRDGEALFRSLAEEAPVMMWATDADGMCTYFNQAWLEFRGRTLEQEHGRGWTEGADPETLDQLEAAFRTALAGRARLRAEYRMRRADGQERWLKVVGTPRFGADGAFAGYVGCTIDITELKTEI